MESVNPYVYDDIDFKYHNPLPPYLQKCAASFSCKELETVATMLIRLRDKSEGYYYVTGIIETETAVGIVVRNLERYYTSIKKSFYEGKYTPTGGNYTLKDYLLGFFSKTVYVSLDSMFYWLEHKNHRDLISTVFDLVEQS